MQGTTGHYLLTCMPVYSILNLIYKLREGGVGGIKNDTMRDFSMMLIAFRIQKHICMVPQVISSHTCVCVFNTEFNIQIKGR